MDIVIDAGRVRRGTYGTITVLGDAVLEDDVTFVNLIVSGTVRCLRCHGGTVIMRSGSVFCGGDVSVERIEGHGRVTISGSLRCETLELTGSLVARGSITARHELFIQGLVRSGEHMAGKDVLIDGSVVSDAGMRAARSVLVRPLGGMALSRYAKDYLLGSRVESIHGAIVRLQGITCGHVTGTDVVLTGGCVVHTIRFTSRLVQDGTSSVLFIEGSRRRIHRRTA